MTLANCAPRHTSDCTPESEALSPTVISYRRVILLVEGVTMDEQQYLYRLLVQWDACRYAGGRGGSRTADAAFLRGC